MEQEELPVTTSDLDLIVSSQTLAEEVILFKDNLKHAQQHQKSKARRKRIFKRLAFIALTVLQFNGDTLDTVIELYTEICAIRAESKSQKARD